MGCLLWGFGLHRCEPLFGGFVGKPEQPVFFFNFIIFFFFGGGVCGLLLFFLILFAFEWGRAAVQCKCCFRLKKTARRISYAFHGEKHVGV